MLVCVARRHTSDSRTRFFPPPPPISRLKHTGISCCRQSPDRALVLRPSADTEVMRPSSRISHPPPPSSLTLIPPATSPTFSKSDRRKCCNMLKEWSIPSQDVKCSEVLTSGRFGDVCRFVFPQLRTPLFSSLCSACRNAYVTHTMSIARKRINIANIVMCVFAFPLSLFCNHCWHETEVGGTVMS